MMKVSILIVLCTLLVQPVFANAEKPIPDTPSFPIHRIQMPDIKKQKLAKPLPMPKPIQKPRVASPVQPRMISGDWIAQCKVWARQAGITLTATHIQLIDKESDCSPTAQNPSSTAYGIGQFLDSTWGLNGVKCVKTSNPVRQLVCMDRYVKVIYGSWSAALAHHGRNGSY